MPKLTSTINVPRERVRWVRIRMRDPLDLGAYERFRRRLRGFTQRSRVNVVTSMSRIALCHCDPATGRIDELLLVEWLQQQPELRSVGDNRGAAPDAQPVAGDADQTPPRESP